MEREGEAVCAREGGGGGAAGAAASGPAFDVRGEEIRMKLKASSVLRSEMKRVAKGNGVSHLLVDPLLEVLVVVERRLLSKLGLDRRSGRARRRRRGRLLLAAPKLAEPRAGRRRLSVVCLSCYPQTKGQRTQEVQLLCVEREG